MTWWSELEVEEQLSWACGLMFLLAMIVGIGVGIWRWVA